jgi:hypothetical protein
MKSMVIGGYEVEVCSFNRFCGYVFNNTMKNVDYMSQFTVMQDLSKTPVKPFKSSQPVKIIEDYKKYVLDVLDNTVWEEVANIIIVRINPREWFITNYKDWSFSFYKDYLVNDHASLSCKSFYETVLIERKKIEFTFKLASYTPKVQEYEMDDQQNSMFDFYSHYVYNKP